MSSFSFAACPATTACTPRTLRASVSESCARETIQMPERENGLRTHPGRGTAALFRASRESASCALAAQAPPTLGTVWAWVLCSVVCREAWSARVDLYPGGRNGFSGISRSVWRAALQAGAAERCSLSRSERCSSSRSSRLACSRAGWIVLGCGSGASHLPGRTGTMTVTLDLAQMMALSHYAPPIREPVAG